MTGDKDDVLIRYQRQGGLVRFTCKGATNHELREVLVGLWARLEPADRAAHLRQLTHYHEGWDDPTVFLSPVARAIRDGTEGENAIDVDRMMRAEHDR